MAIVRVAAAVILRPDEQVLLAQRPPGKAYAGYWEFPGGKLEPGETPRHALDRELQEELGLTVREAAPWFVQRYVYPHAHVELNFFRVFAWDGEPVGHDGQAFAWQVPGRFNVAPLLPANTRVLRALELPAMVAFVALANLQSPAGWRRIDAALRAGLRLIVAAPDGRDPSAAGDALKRLVRRAAKFGCRVYGAAADEVVRNAGAAGVYRSAEQLAGATSRPADLECAASCVTAAHLRRAAALGFDFTVVGPVRPDQPGERSTGWPGFASAIAGAELPVFAWGTLDAADLRTAIAHGAHGIALPLAGDRVRAVA